jgi:carbon storage regulator
MGPAMFVIRRRAGEAIVIGGDVEVTIVEISPTRVKLGIGAPRAVSVTRKETVSLAVDNHRAADFLRGGGLDEIMRILSRDDDAAIAFRDTADKD